MPPANTKPEWMNDPDISPNQIEDPALIASIEAAMKTRGVEAPTNGWRANGSAPATSQTSSDSAPGAPTPQGPAASGFFARDAAPAGDEAGDGSPVVPGQVSPATDPALPPAESDAPVEPTPPPEGTFRVDLGNGSTWDMNEEQAKYLLGINSWVTSQPDLVKQQWRGIEDGTHTAIPSADYSQYQQWVQAGRPSSQPQPITQPQAPPKPDLTMLDPETASYLQFLEARQAPTPTPQVAAPVQTPQVQQPSEADIAARVTHQAAQQVTSNAILRRQQRT